ncbi:hypothetical protein SAMN05444266_102283 [Chitinophaga jiangningensis]|uniref:Uncharacterized protein n=1 Tax=Chitinophaga jiangningensis TaxID=1419482 RepID=A0A1M6YEQ9_9BACT|nr:hypothetical protein [Chitinophaga jiangningensis]SHL16728.1 hypothetical protein SAMN05444266_102283 [Chitinophaga jiangningensis]
MKSFYDNDFLIELNEKRCAEYASLAQQMTSRFSMLFVFYSVLMAASVPVVKQLLKGGSVDWMLAVLFLLFSCSLIISIRYAISLIITGDLFVIYLPKRYYSEIKDYLIERIPADEIALETSINEVLKKLYLYDLERVLEEHAYLLLNKQRYLQLGIRYSILTLVFFLLNFWYYLFHY